jgi:hypothetical protein
MDMERAEVARSLRSGQAKDGITMVIPYISMVVDPEHETWNVDDSITEITGSGTGIAFMQEVCPGAVVNHPRSHAVQNEALDVLENVPCPQMVQVVALDLLENAPCAHGVHVEEPGALWWYPGLQTVQALACVGLKLPAGH